ncbi:MAG: hypothetical protein IJA54_09445 [Tyzzerella sp.]|nr:hypothetical protein [Tyzzerella sp.]
MTDKKQQEQKNEKRSPATKYILVAVILILLSLLMRCGIDYHNRKTAEELNEIVSEFEESIDAITEMEDAMKQEAVDTLVEEGMMHVNFSTKAYFDGKVSTKFNIKNIENNHDDIVFEIFDEDGESLYKSKKIPPGYEMNCIELDRELSKGRHECTIEVHYAVEGQISTVFPIILMVE